MPVPLSVSTRLAYQHQSLPGIINGLGDAELRRQIIAGKWSIFENIVHLQTYQHMFVTRLDKMQAESIPVFPAYVAEADPLFHDNCGRPTGEVMNDLDVTRNEMNADLLLYSDLDLDKKGIHAVYGEMNVMQWINFFLLHEAHHLLTIFKLAATLRKTGQVEWHHSRNRI